MLPASVSPSIPPALGVNPLVEPPLIQGSAVGRAAYVDLSERMFVRYDLDRTGTINSDDELTQLTFNMAFKLGLADGGLDAVLDKGKQELGLSPAGWALEDFRRWFAAQVLGPRGITVVGS
jgi:hypothetical protein